MTTDATETGRRYKGVDPAERVAQRRARILAAGLELFGTRGYQQTTLAMLSVESGVPHRYLTQIFPGKEAILRELYLDIAGTVMETVRAARQPMLADPFGPIRHDVASACRAFMADPRRLRINCLEVIGVSPEFEQLRRKVIREFSQLILDEIGKLVAAGLLPARSDYVAGTTGLVGAFHELMTEWVLMPKSKRPAPEVLVHQIQEFFRGMLLAVLNPLPE